VVEVAGALAAEAREKARIEVSSASELARAMQFSLRREFLPGMDGLTIRGTRLIVVSPKAYKPQEEFTIGHEIGHSLAHEGIPDYDAFPRHVRECVADHISSALLMPKVPFMDSWMVRGCELPDMQEKDWAWASHEAIARRLVDVLPNVICSKWVDEKPRRRWPLGAPEVTSSEFAAVRDAMKKGRGFVLSGGRVSIAWSMKPAGARSRAIGVCLPATHQFLHR
jgi:hypothetical protein